MSKEDWIILRMLFVAVECDARKTFKSVDAVRTISYLLDKYGRKHVRKCVDQLHEEKMK